MITEQDKEFIKNNYDSLLRATQDGVLKVELKGRMQKRFPLDCWNCPRKIKVNIKNYLDEYGRSNIKK